MLPLDGEELLDPVPDGEFVPLGLFVDGVLCGVHGDPFRAIVEFEVVLAPLFEFPEALAPVSGVAAPGVAVPAGGVAVVGHGVEVDGVVDGVIVVPRRGVACPGVAFGELTLG